MSPPTAEQITRALDGVHDPEIRRPITELGMVKGIDVAADGAVRVQVWLTVTGCPLRETIIRDVTAAVGKLPGVSSVRLDLDVMSDEQRRALQTQLRDVAQRARLMLRFSAIHAGLRQDGAARAAAAIVALLNEAR